MVANWVIMIAIEIAFMHLQWRHTARDICLTKPASIYSRSAIYNETIIQGSDRLIKPECIYALIEKA